MAVSKIGVLTSGGDAPGMNAAVRGVVRAAISEEIEVYGVYDGFFGLHKNHIEKLNRKSVADLINRGGTFLGSARFPEFKEESVRRQAIENLKLHGIEALVVIGGDGSYMGAKKLTEMGYPCIGLPGTIDNDAPGTDYTIGYYTALNTVIDAIDRLRDTSSSHHRISIVEVMGRHCPDLTLMAAIATGSEFIVTPDTGLNIPELVARIKEGFYKGKKHAIITVTELMTDCAQLAKEIESATGHETRATILGHIQRGGQPTAFDRILASRMGAYAVELLISGEGGRCVGVRNEQMVHHDIIEAIETMKHPVREDYYKLASKLF